MRVALVAFAILQAARALASPSPCVPADLEARSYRLVTEVQARIVGEPRYRWWDAFDLGKHEDALDDLNSAATRAAERALDLDPRNVMAQALLARQYVVVDEPELAVEAWAKALEAGLAVVWTATLYDVDARTYFVMAFDRRELRVYTFEALVGPVERRFGGIPEFPGPDREGFWRGMAGCIDAGVVPEARVPWSDVREIKAGNWVLWFKLARPVRIASDRKRKKKELREIKVALHGRTGSLEAYKPVGEDQLALRGRGPAGYQDLIRRTLVRFVDPERRIALPPLKPGVGW